MDDTKDLQELVDEVTGPAEEWAPREGACDVCDGDLSPIHDKHTAPTCHRCWYGRLSVGQRCDLVAEMTMEWAAKGLGDFDVVARLKDAVSKATLMAESRDARLVGQWADGFLAGLRASRKLPPSGMAPEVFAKLSEEWSNQPQPTGD